MESKNILRFFGTLPVLLAEGKLPTKLMTNFPSKKAFDLTMSHYSHCLVRMETDKHWNTTGIFHSSDKSSLLRSLETPWLLRDTLLGTVMVEQGNQILMRGISRDFRYKVWCARRKGICNMNNLIMWYIYIYKCIYFKAYQGTTGGFFCSVCAHVNLTQNVSDTIPRNVNVHFVFQNRIPDPTVCWLLHHVCVNNQ